ncbi:hypothetical protein ACTJIJ_23030 [Niabella sp. 22666]|uniref:hypothetical protein n=1 Tax=Niabella sp. 22666 TaxID=3453954 RepID=UPI003F878D77
MARTRLEIQQSIEQILTDEMKAIGVTIEPATWSKTNIFRLCCFVFSFCSHVLESIFDVFKSDVDTELLNRLTHTRLWYANTLKGYMHGHSFDELGLYDLTGLDDEQIAAAKVVKYASVTEALSDNGSKYLRAKVAGESGSDLEPLTVGQLNGLKVYIEQLRDAGVEVVCESNEPDRIKMIWKIFYNPIILDATGSRLDGTANDIVRRTIKDYLKRIAFDGVYAIQKHEDYVQQVEGVELCPVQLVQTAYGLYDWQDVEIMTIPDAGFMRFDSDDDLVIEFIPYNV